LLSKFPKLTENVINTRKITDCVMTFRFSKFFFSKSHFSFISKPENVVNALLLR